MIIGLEKDPVTLCDLCYEESPTADFYNLSCHHNFCKPCHEEFLRSAIEGGKVLKLTCMQGGCEKEYHEKNIRDCVSEDLFLKYKRFVTNAMIDLDPELRWCPNADCGGSIRKPEQSKETTGTCEDCGAELCFLCSERAHPGSACGDSEEQKLF